MDLTMDKGGHSHESSLPVKGKNFYNYAVFIYTYLTLTFSSFAANAEL